MTVLDSKTNQKTLAKLLGVSQSTISKALNDSPKVSGLLKERIRQLSNEVGYIPDYNATSLSSGRTMMISAVVTPIPGLTVSDIHSRWIAHMGAIARQKGYRLRIDFLDDVERIIKERSADGLIVFGDHALPPLGSMPTVFTDCRASAGPGFVTTDNAGGTAEAVEHLLELGHRRIAFFGHMNSQYADPSHERYLGYLRALNRSGVPSPADFAVEQRGWPVEVDDMDEYGGAIRDLMSRGVTAFVASSDVAAAGIARCAMRAGLGIPSDVSVTGFDDTLLARGFEPPLTTVRQDTVTSSRLAVEMLLEAIDGHPMRGGTVVPAPLVIRASTGPVPLQ